VLLTKIDLGRSVRNKVDQNHKLDPKIVHPGVAAQDDWLTIMVRVALHARVEDVAPPETTWGVIQRRVAASFLSFPDNEPTPLSKINHPLVQAKD
jgi:hypothetical protein